MRLELGDGTVTDNPDEKAIENAFERVVGMSDKFVILSVNDLTYMQSSTAGDGLFDLEYQLGNAHQHYRCTDESLTQQQVVEVFCRFVRREPDWNGTLQWKHMRL